MPVSSVRGCCFVCVFGESTSRVFDVLFVFSGKAQRASMLFRLCFRGKHVNSLCVCFWGKHSTLLCCFLCVFKESIRVLLHFPPSPYHSFVGRPSSKGSPFSEDVEGDALAKVRHVVGGKTQLELECQVVREDACENPTIDVVSLLWRRVRVRRDELPRVQVEEVRNRSVPRVLRRLRGSTAPST